MGDGVSTTTTFFRGLWCDGRRSWFVGLHGRDNDEFRRRGSGYIGDRSGRGFVGDGRRRRIGRNGRGGGHVGGTISGCIGGVAHVDDLAIVIGIKWCTIHDKLGTALGAGLEVIRTGNDCIVPIGAFGRAVNDDHVV